MSEFKREDRYLVLKRSDIESALDSGMREMLLYYAQQVEAERHSLGKDILECVVVESDWPIYGDVWKMVEAIASNQPTELERLRRALDITTKALLKIESTPFDVEGFGSASEAAAWMNGLATETLAKLNKPNEE